MQCFVTIYAALNRSKISFCYRFLQNYILYAYNLVLCYWLNVLYYLVLLTLMYHPHLSIFGLNPKERLEPENDANLKASLPELG